MFGGRLGPTELIIILVIVLLLFGARKLPDLAKSVGSSLKIFKRELKDPETPAASPDAPAAPPAPVVPSPDAADPDGRSRPAE